MTKAKWRPTAKNCRAIEALAFDVDRQLQFPINLSVKSSAHNRSQGCLHDAAEMARSSLAFFSLTGELTIAAWNAVDAKWDVVPRSYAPAWHTFMALRAVQFQIQDIVRHIVDLI